MPRFFLEEIGEQSATIAGEDARHIIKSLRMQPGEALTLCDTHGFDYHCVIREMDHDTVYLQVIGKNPSQSEVSCKLRLFQALPKGDKLEFVIQKATELGVSEIIPVITARCISRPHARSMEKKQERLAKIAYEAAKQSGRSVIPSILPTMTFTEAIRNMSSDELPILFYEESTTPLRQLLLGNPSTISIMVGSEGGFSAKEVSEAGDAGIRIASLGNRILRCETAPVCALSSILYFLGEL